MIYRALVMVPSRFLFSVFAFLLTSCSITTKGGPGVTGPGTPQSQNDSCVTMNGSRVCPEKKIVGGKSYLLIGDMKFNARLLKSQSALRGATAFGQGYQTYFWPTDDDGVTRIAYTIESASLNSIVATSLADLQTRSGVRFVARTTEANYINFVEVVSQAGDTFVTCGLSYVGRIEGKQDIELSLNAACKNRTTGTIQATVQHEVMHALGFFHEQNRMDRDDHVRLFTERLDPACASEYAKIAFSDGIGGYDPLSITHYSANVCSLYEGYNVMQATTQEITDAMGHTPKATASDIAGIVSIYGAGLRISVAADQTSATFIYKTATSVPSRIRYGRFQDEMTELAEDLTEVSSHRLIVSGLTPQKRYYYQVETAPGLWSAFRSFLTDSTEPVISDVQLTVDDDRIMEFKFTTEQPAMSLLLVCDTEECDGDVSTFFQDGDYFGTLHNYVIELGARKYFVYGYAEDGAGNYAFTDVQEADADNAPPVLSNPAVTSRSANGAVISWTTDEAALSRVNYGTSSASLTSSQAASTPMGRTHSVTLSGLQANTTYYVMASSADAKGQAANSATFRVSTDLTGPVISNLTISDTKISSAKIDWTTNEPADALIQFGTSSSSLTRSVSSAECATSQALSLTGLAASTTYYFKVTSKDAAGNPSVSGVHSFVTAANVPPVISGTTIVQGTKNITLTWNTDVAATTHAQYGTSPGVYAFTTGSSALVTSHSVDLTAGLTSGTTYYFKIMSVSAAGAVVTTNEQTFVYRPTDSVSVTVVNDPYFALARFVYASSTSHASVTLTLQIRTASTGQVIYTSAMSYAYFNGAYRHFAEIPSPLISQDLRNGILKMRILSSGGGSVEWTP